MERGEREVADAGPQDGWQPVSGRHVTNPIGHHGAAVLVGGEHRRVHHRKQASRHEHPMRFGACRPRIGGIVQRAIEYDQIELRRLERQRAEVGDDSGDRRQIPTRRAETVELVLEQIDSDDLVPRGGKSVREPRVAGTQFEHAERA